MKHNKNKNSYKEIDDNTEVIYKGDAVFEDVDDDVEQAIKLLTEKGRIKDGKIIV